MNKSKFYFQSDIKVAQKFQNMPLKGKKGVSFLLFFPFHALLSERIVLWHCGFHNDHVILSHLQETLLSCQLCSF